MAKQGIKLASAFWSKNRWKPRTTRPAPVVEILRSWPEELKIPARIRRICQVYVRQEPWNAVKIEKKPGIGRSLNGASEGIRTLDIHVGNVTLYQTELRSLARKGEEATGISTDCKHSFAVLAP